jgi:hypothetical protein
MWAGVITIGIDKLHRQGLGVTPRRKPRGKDRPPEDIAFNRAFSRRRIVVEHTIGRIRRYEAVTQTDRDHRNHQSARVRAALAEAAGILSGSAVPLGGVVDL